MWLYQITELISGEIRYEVEEYQCYIKMSIHGNAIFTTQKWASPPIYIILYKQCNQRNAQYMLMSRFQQWDLGCISASIYILRKFLCAQIIGKGRYRKKCGFCLQRTSRLCGEYTEKEVEYADKTWVTTSNPVFTMHAAMKLHLSVHNALL